MESNPETSDPIKLQRKEIRSKMRVQQSLGDLGFVMSDPAGRRFIHHLLEICGIMKLSYSGPGRNEETCFYEGQRNIGNQIFKDVVKNFKNEWLLMNEEANNEERKNG